MKRIATGVVYGLGAALAGWNLAHAYADGDLVGVVVFAISIALLVMGGAVNGQDACQTPKDAPSGRFKGLAACTVRVGARKPVGAPR